MPQQNTWRAITDGPALYNEVIQTYGTQPTALATLAHLQKQMKYWRLENGIR